MYPYSNEGHYSDGIHFKSQQYDYMIQQIEGKIKKGLSLPFWLVKPRYFWIPSLIVAALGYGGYIAYTTYMEGDEWDTPRIS